MGRIGLSAGIYPLKSADETFTFGMRVASLVPKQAILALSGDLGVGKTTFVQGLGRGLGILEPIQSPTFVLLNLYDRLAHFDLYRLKNLDDFKNLGFEEYFQANLISAIEWPEKIREIVPPDTLWIHFDYEERGRIVKVL